MEPISFVESRTLYCADNLRQLVDFPSECVDLIYLDPPFFSNRHYEVIWGDEAEVRSFEDRWEGGIQVYVNWMRERVVEMHRVLKPTGSLYLHCDAHAGHYLKVMLDGIFDPKDFRNEIVWAYKYGGRPRKDFGRKHDTIFRYAKSSEWFFDEEAVRIPHEPASIEHNYRHIDEEGRRYREDNWRGQKKYRYYADEGRGRDDVWTDIGSLHHEDKERLGYPTQKPEKLLEVIIGASSKKGDLVMDPFCGCGTTIAVAERLGREWIGIDVSPTAVGLMKRRVEKEGARNVRVVGVPVSPLELKELKPFEFQNQIMQRLNGTHSARKTGDMGIDGFSFMLHDPIQVKQSERVGRNVIDNFETAIERAKSTKGFVVAFSFTKGAYEEVARVKAEKGLEIYLLKVADLFGPEDQPDLKVPELSAMFPEPPKTFLDLPLPEARDKKARPSPDELIQSDRIGGTEK